MLDDEVVVEIVLLQLLQGIGQLSAFVGGVGSNITPESHGMVYRRSLRRDTLGHSAYDLIIHGRNASEEIQLRARGPIASDFGL